MVDCVTLFMEKQNRLENTRTPSKRNWPRQENPNRIGSYRGCWDWPLSLWILVRETINMKNGGHKKKSILSFLVQLASLFRTYIPFLFANKHVLHERYIHSLRTNRSKDYGQ